ncbi:MAG TPA: hypothetical protein VH591_10685 [Ktedonobacterales bacterium]|jgi:hypothetical protein
MDDPNEIRLPSHPAQESGLIAVKAALSAVPGFGGPAAEILGGSIALIQRRRETAFLERVLNELRKRLDQLPESIGENESFKTTLLRAARIAAETHDEEILDALRNAVVNVAIGEGPDDSLQSIFMEAIRGMTHWHIWLLACIADPIGWANERKYPIAPGNTPDPVVTLEAYYRGKLPAEHFEDQVFQALFNLGLTTNNTMPAGLPTGTMMRVQPQLTDMGKKFLAFIAAPKMPETTAGENQPAQAGLAAE